jgi:hypothetical protein
VEWGKPPGEDGEANFTDILQAYFEETNDEVEETGLSSEGCSAREFVQAFFRSKASSSARLESSRLPKCL